MFMATITMPEFAPCCMTQARRFHRVISAGLVYGLLLVCSISQAAEFSIDSANTYLNQGVYNLNTDIHYELSEEILEALGKGIPITFQLLIEIEQPRRYMWNEHVTSRTQRTVLLFHALSEQYLVKNMASGEQQSFRLLNSALKAIGEIRNVPLLAEGSLEKGVDYQVRLRSEIDINALPAPLRPVAWVSDGWKLATEWFICPLRS